MSFSIEGYCLLKGNFDKEKHFVGTGNFDNYRGVLRCLEINETGALVLASDDSGMAMIDTEAIHHIVSAEIYQGVIMPPRLSLVDKFLWFQKVFTDIKDIKMYNAAFLADAFTRGYANKDFLNNVKPA